MTKVEIILALEDLAEEEGGKNAKLLEIAGDLVEMTCSKEELLLLEDE